MGLRGDSQHQTLTVEKKDTLRAQPTLYLKTPGEEQIKPRARRQGLRRIKAEQGN